MPTTTVSVLIFMTKPKIVILDSYAVNPGDLDFSQLEELGELRLYDRTALDQVVERCSEAQIALSNKTRLQASALAELPNLKFISVLATGYNEIDLKYARQQGIVVSNVPAYSTMSVAQNVAGHLLNLSLRIADHASDVRRGGWTAQPDFCYWKYPLIELDEKTLGLVGWGRIAQAVARIGLSLGMQVNAFSPSLAQGGKKPGIDGVKFRPIADILSESDVISLHCPLTDDNYQMINARVLSMVRRGCWLINTARGKLIDEQAVASALESGQLGAYAGDVLTQEPPLNGSPLLSAPNCFLTPHNAWATQAARKRLISVSVDNIRAFLSGKPQNVVN